MKLFPILLFSATVISIASCSIKEDRSGCPCVLTIDASNIRADEISIICSNTSRLLKTVLIPIETGPILRINVPRGHVNVATYTGNEFSKEQNDTLVIPYGKEADCIYANACQINTEAETAYTRIALNKQFARISLEFANLPEDWSVLNTKLTVSGKTNGLSLNDLSPSEGEFKCDVAPDNKGIFSFKVPRQKGNDLYCRIENEEQISAPIALGEILESIGFDWTKENLDDISLELEFPSSVISVSITDWDDINTEVIL